jgi:putative transposase
LKWLPIVDQYSRELLSIEVARSITAEDVVRDLERLVRELGAPEFIRSDNGPQVLCACGEGLDRGEGLQDLLHRAR